MWTSGWIILGHRLFFLLLFNWYQLSIIHSQSTPNNFDRLFNELNILTQQQLDQLQATTTSSTTTSTTTTTSTNRPNNYIANDSLDNKLKSSSILGKNLTLFRLPDGYDASKPPKFNKHKPIDINVNLTVLDVTIDKHENLIVLDLQLQERWKDRRLRVKIKNDNEKNNDDDDYETEYGNTRKFESQILNGEWLANIWHPISRLRNNAHVTNALFDKPKQSLQKIIEQEKLIDNIYILANASMAFVSVTFKMRVNIPIYECKRDDNRQYPFDKIHCSFHIANAFHDKETLVYKWDQVKWDHNEYHNGQFYLKKLSTSIDNEPIVDIDESGSEHSIMKIDFMLKRQIGDYVLNIYVLHIFLLTLSISTFWISIQNIIVRMSLTIIILVIIKFQTFQTLKDGHRIVSALSIWTFGLSCLIILCILCHIVSYYSHQHKWNSKILNKIIIDKRSSSTAANKQTYPDDNNSNNNNNNNNNNGSRNEHQHPQLASSTECFANDDGNLSNGSSVNGNLPNIIVNSIKWQYIKLQWNKCKRNIFIWLNSIIVNNSKNQSYDDTNLVDIIARIVLIIIYLLFIGIYFIKYAI